MTGLIRASIEHYPEKRKRKADAELIARAKERRWDYNKFCAQAKEFSLIIGRSFNFAKEGFKVPVIDALPSSRRLISKS